MLDAPLKTDSRYRIAEAELIWNQSYVQPITSANMEVQHNDHESCNFSFYSPQTPAYAALNQEKRGWLFASLTYPRYSSQQES